jgi:DDE superfamily endonuclease
MDEMGVDIDHNNDIYWIKPGQKRPIRYRFPQKVKVNIWGAIWYNGRTSLHFTKKTFNSNHYIHVLQGHLRPHLPLQRKEFIHDGVPWHWTHAVQNWCDYNRVSVVQDFPAQSPDLNAIEYVWAYVKTQGASWTSHQLSVAQECDSLCLGEIVSEHDSTLHQSHGDGHAIYCGFRGLGLDVMIYFRWVIFCTESTLK